MEEIREIISFELDTRDKRYMFLRLMFPSLIAKIDLEGSSSQAAYNICDAFTRHGRVKELKNVVLTKLKI